MTTTAKLAAAVAGGHLLGRTTTLRLTILLAGMLAGEKLGANPRSIANQIIDRSPGEGSGQGKSAEEGQFRLPLRHVRGGGHRVRARHRRRRVMAVSPSSPATDSQDRLRKASDARLQTLDDRTTDAVDAEYENEEDENEEDQR